MAYSMFNQDYKSTTQQDSFVLLLCYVKIDKFFDNKSLVQEKLNYLKTFFNAVFYYILGHTVN